MATIRFDLNEHYNTLLQENAKNMNMSIQDYIRHKLFDIQTIFTVAEAIKRIQNGNFSDPVKYPDAKKYETVTYNEVLAKDLKVMDATAISLCRENKLPIIVFNSLIEGNLKKVVMGKHIGTIVVAD